MKGLKVIIFSNLTEKSSNIQHTKLFHDLKEILWLMHSIYFVEEEF